MKKVVIADTLFLSIVYSILIVAMVVVMFPLIHILAASFSSPNAIARGAIWLWPRDFSLQGYNTILSNSQIINGYRNTVLYVVLGTSINTLLTIFAAYPLSRKRLPGKNIIMFMFSFTMLFSGGLIPTYFVVMNLGMIDSVWAIIIPNAINVWLLIIARTFFNSTIPLELYESASIDGCNDFGALWTIVIPLSKAIIAVLILNFIVIYWNGYFDAMIYLRSPDKYPLQIILREILIANTISLEMIKSIPVGEQIQRQMLSFLLKYSLIVISSVPMLIIYQFVQKYFVKGVLIGAIKG